MEPIGGESPVGSLPLEKVLEYARQIADALSAAQDKGVVHRGLKPQNIKVLPDGRVKVLDFGLAKMTGKESGAWKTAGGGLCASGAGAVGAPNSGPAGVAICAARYVCPAHAHAPHDPRPTRSSC